MRCEAVNALLLNEFLKAHRKLENQQATIAEQQKEIKALTAGFKAQVARALRSRCRIQRKHESQHHVSGCKTLRSRLRPARRTEATEWQRIGNQINTALIAARVDVVNVYHRQLSFIRRG